MRGGPGDGGDGVGLVRGGLRPPLPGDEAELLLPPEDIRTPHRALLTAVDDEVLAPLCSAALLAERASA